MCINAFISIVGFTSESTVKRLLAVTCSIADYHPQQTSLHNSDHMGVACSQKRPQQSASRQQQLRQLVKIALVSAQSFASKVFARTYTVVVMSAEWTNKPFSILLAEL